MSAKFSASLLPQVDCSGRLTLRIWRTNSADKVDAEGKLSPSRTEPRGIAMAPAVMFKRKNTPVTKAVDTPPQAPH